VGNRALHGNGDGGNTAVTAEIRGFAGETCGNTAEWPVARMELISTVIPW